MRVGRLDRLDEQSRARLLAEAFERSAVAKAVAAVEPGSLAELVEVNPAFCDLVQYAREELLGQSGLMLFDSADQAGAQRSQEALVRGEGTEVVVERQVVRRDGSRRQATPRPLRSSFGKGLPAQSLRSLRRPTAPRNRRVRWPTKVAATGSDRLAYST